MEKSKIDKPDHDRNDHDGKDKTVKIFVNTEPHEVPKGKITYERVVALAYPTPPTGENILITVKYRKGQGNKEGFLTAGESVQVVDGMIFSVSATDKS